MKEQIAELLGRMQQAEARHSGYRYARRPFPADATRPIRDDVLDEDSLYETRMPTIVRSYQQPRTALRVTHHPIARRASATTQRPAQKGKQHQVSRQPFRMQWTSAVVAGMSATLALIFIAQVTVNWWKTNLVDWQYGRPRTFQCDMDVKHGGISHFTVENLNGHIIITEVIVNHLDRTKIYDGPVLSGAGTDLDPATLQFQDVNHDGLPDMLLTVENRLYVYINQSSEFRASTATEPINQGGTHG